MSSPVSPFDPCMLRSPRPPPSSAIFLEDSRSYSEGHNVPSAKEEGTWGEVWGNQAQPPRALSWAVTQDMLHSPSNEL